MILKQILILFLILNLTCCDKAKNKTSEDNSETFGGILYQLGKVFLIGGINSVSTKAWTELREKIFDKNITNSWL